ncbi:MAG: type IV pilus biogenesis/stability protein PilW [Aestuariibacter sp.]
MYRALTFLILLLLSGCASQSQRGNGYDGSFDPVEAAKTRVSLGLTYLKNGNYTQAKTNLDKALSFAPRLSDAHFAMGYYYQSVSEFDLADQFYSQAIALDKSNPDLLNTYGAFLCQKGDYQRSEEYLLKAINSRNYANAAESYENLAICSHSQAKINKAIEYLSTALKHQPGRAKSWYMMIELLIAQGRWQEAKVAFRQYEKVVPVNADSLALAIEIEQGLGNSDVAQGYQDMFNKLYPERANLKRTQILKMPQSGIAQSLDSRSQAGTKPMTHVIQKGENLYRIALKYKVRMQWLIDWNNIDDVSNLSVGQSIFVSNPNQ